MKVFEMKATLYQLKTFNALPNATEPGIIVLVVGSDIIEVKKKN